MRVSEEGSSKPERRSDCLSFFRPSADPSQHQLPVCVSAISEPSGVFAPPTGRDLDLPWLLAFAPKRSVEVNEKTCLRSACAARVATIKSRFRR